MDFRPSFKKILSEKLQQDTETPVHQDSAVLQDPAHLSYLLGQIPRLDIQLRRFRYPHTPRTRPAHILTPIQTEAFDFIQSLVKDFSPAFTNQELRKAFRQAALKTHPDQGGSAEMYLKLKTYYRTLQTVLPTPAMPAAA